MINSILHYYAHLRFLCRVFHLPDWRYRVSARSLASTIHIPGTIVDTERTDLDDIDMSHLAREPQWAKTIMI